MYKTDYMKAFREIMKSLIMYRLCPMTKLYSEYISTSKTESIAQYLITAAYINQCVAIQIELFRDEY